MKKFLSLLILLLLCVGCSSQSKLVKTSNDKILSQLDSIYIDSISIYDDDYNIFSFIFSDSENFNKAKSAIKDINVSKKDASLIGNPLNIDMYTEDGFVTVILYDSAVKVIDSDYNETIYTSDNSSAIRNELTNVAQDNNENNHYTSDGELLFEYNDLSVYKIGEEVSENGSHQLEIQFINNSADNYEIVMHSMVNGIYTHGYQSYMCFSSDAIGYTIDTNDFIYQSFANEDPSSIYYFFEVYKMNAETYERLGLVYTSDLIELFDNGTNKLTNLTPVYEDDAIRLYSNLMDDEMYVQANFYIENKLNEDIKVKYTSFELNGETHKDEYPQSVTVVPVKASANSFNLIPIYTFEYNDETGDISYFTADSIKFDIEIVVSDTIQTGTVTLR